MKKKFLFTTTQEQDLYLEIIHSRSCACGRRVAFDIGWIATSESLTYVTCECGVKHSVRLLPDGAAGGEK